MRTNNGDMARINFSLCQLASESHPRWGNTVPRYGTRPRDHPLRPLEGSAEAVSTLRGMRVAVNSDLCQGHNRCYALAPELFDVDDYGNAIVLGDGSVPPAPLRW